MKVVRNRSFGEIFSVYAQPLYNYGMNAHNNPALIKNSLIQFYSLLRSQVDTLKPSEKGAVALFRYYREFLVTKYDLALFVDEVSFAPGVSALSREAMFLKLSCGFSYKEVSDIMAIEYNEAYALATEAIDMMSNHPIFS